MKHYCLVILVYFLELALTQTIYALKPLDIDQLDTFYLSKIRYESRGLPKLARCGHFSKLLVSRIKGEEVQYSGLPKLSQVDTNLIERVSNLLKSKIKSGAGNSLTDFLDNCVQIVNDYRRENGIEVETKTEQAVEPDVKESEAKPVDNVALVELMRKNKELIKQASELQLQRDFQIEQNKQLSSQIELLSSQVRENEAEIQSLRQTKREPEPANVQPNPVSDTNSRLTEELEKKDEEIEKLKQANKDLERRALQLEQVDLKKARDDNERLMRQLGTASSELEVLKKKIASQTTQKDDRQSYAELLMLKTRIEALELNEARLEQDLAFKLAQYRELSSTCELHKSSVATCGSSLANCRESFSMAKAELARVLDRNENNSKLYKTNLAEKEGKISQLTSSISQLKSQNEVLAKKQAELSLLTKQFDQLRESESDCRSDVKVKQAKIMELWNWGKRAESERDEARKKSKANERPHSIPVLKFNGF